MGIAATVVNPPRAEAFEPVAIVGAAFGITGIETSFQLLYTHLVKPGIASLEQLLNWMITQPAKAFNLAAQTTLAVGEIADLALFDLETAHTITADEFVSKGVNTPFIGETIYGQTVLTVVAGNVVYEA